MIGQLERDGSAPTPAGDELCRRIAELERRVARQAWELAGAREELDTLAQSMSHDLRSPLNVIGGFVELLARDSGKALGEKGRHYLKRISTAAEQMGHMIDEVVALSRMSLCEIHLAPTDLAPLVRKVVHALDAEKGDRRVIWLIGRLPTVTADASLIRQAISSLASNAFRFTRAREVARIQIGVQESGGELVFFVRDNGASFDMRHRRMLFDPAPRPHAASAPRGGAIRLAHVQRIIERHGGRLWTEAVPDGGATFYFSLPGELAQTPCIPAPQ